MRVSVDQDNSKIVSGQVSPDKIFDGRESALSSAPNMKEPDVKSDLSPVTPIKADDLDKDSLMKSVRSSIKDSLRNSMTSSMIFGDGPGDEEQFLK